MSVLSITDTRVRLRPSKQLVDLLAKHKDKFTEIPENISKALKRQHIQLPSNVEIYTKELEIKRPKIDNNLLKELVKDGPGTGTLPISDLADILTEQNVSKAEKQAPSKSDKSIYFYLSDVQWIHDFLVLLRHEHNCDIFLHELLQSCELVLPENDIRPRNPELEARCQRLRAQQENFEYNRMTKNVDSSRQKYPEDTISYQIKAINKQLVAVFQFVVSVVTGFVFGFWGLQLIFGNLQFGFRLILGIICALIIALAEMYFLAVKLNEYDNVVDSQNIKNQEINQSVKPTSKKPHID